MCVCGGGSVCGMCHQKITTKKQKEADSTRKYILWKSDARQYFERLIFLWFVQPKAGLFQYEPWQLIGKLDLKFRNRWCYAGVSFRRHMRDRCMYICVLCPRISCSSSISGRNCHFEEQQPGSHPDLSLAIPVFGNQDCQYLP